MARARQGNNVKRSLKVFVIGEEGSRKSGTAVDVSKLIREDGKPMRVLYVDIENGSIDGFHLDRLEKEGVDLKNILIIYTSEYGEIEDYCNRFVEGSHFYEIEETVGEDGKVEFIEAFGDEDKVIRDADGDIFIPDAIVIDGVTVIGESIKFSSIEISEDRASIKADVQLKSVKEKRVAVETAGLEFKDHDKIKMKGVKLIANLIRSTPKHVILTGRSKPETVMKKVDKTMTLVPTGRDIPEHWKWLGYDVHTYIHQSMKDGRCYGKILNKDRTGKYGQGDIIENPSMAEFQSIIDKNKGLKNNNFLTQDSYEKTFEKNKESMRNDFDVAKQPLSKSQIIDSMLDTISEMSSIKKDNLKSKLKELNIKGSDINKDMEMELAKKVNDIVINL